MTDNNSKECMFTSQGFYKCTTNPLFVDHLGQLNDKPRTPLTWKILDKNPVCNVELPCCENINKSMHCRLNYCCSEDR